MIVGLSDLPDSPKFKEGKSEPKDCNPEGGGVHIKQTIIQLLCVCRILFHVLMAICWVNSHQNQQHFSYHKQTNPINTVKVFNPFYKCFTIALSFEHCLPSKLNT